MDITGISPLSLPLASAKGASTAATTESTFRDILSSASAPKDADKAKNAAKQFEGLMIGQMLKSARESADSGWMGLGDDQSGATALELAEEQFGQAMAAGGGLLSVVADDAAVLATLSFEPLNPAVPAIEPFAHGAEDLTKIDPVDAHMYDPHSGFPKRCL